MHFLDIKVSVCFNILKSSLINTIFTFFTYFFNFTRILTFLNTDNCGNGYLARGTARRKCFEEFEIHLKI